MSTLALWFGMGMTVLAGCTVLGLIGLRGFLAWLDYKRAALDVARPPAAGARIDVADLKERVRKLEAIAAGVEY